MLKPSGLVLCAMGQAFRMSTRNLLEYMTKGRSPDQTTKLFYAIDLMDIIAGPALNFLLATTFKQGLKLGRLWTGLPFFSIAFLFGIVTVIVFSVSAIPSDAAKNSPTSNSEATSPTASVAHLQERPE